ncbi:Os07g0167800 [Oryza sativa Japonica Group]|uniref:Os07g0167800 protein n=1 Tax=Oryza sativa subsp. japonica TaxID=39947 RepID=Q0D8C9_ORYSJ|nr:Os07g0167800 [Oryza sativa Japonica Group]|eukprot:NP_001058980.1 Os07g0167800 [Oryza sativa Japonica Group]
METAAEKENSITRPQDNGGSLQNKRKHEFNMRRKKAWLRLQGAPSAGDGDDDGHANTLLRVGSMPKTMLSYEDNNNGLLSDEDTICISPAPREQ